jgi:hypothetical protein
MTSLIFFFSLVRLGDSLLAFPPALHPIKDRDHDPMRVILQYVMSGCRAAWKV